MPKYGIAEWCVDHESTDIDVVSLTARHELSTLHLAINTIDDVAKLGNLGWQKATMSRCHETDVHISCLALNIAERTAICGMGADEGTRSQFMEIIRLTLEFSAIAQVPLIYVPSFGLAEITSDLALYETAELLRDAAELARPFKIEIASENSLGPLDTVRLVEQVCHDNFRILFDIYNPRRWGHSPMEIIETSFEVFSDQIHIKDGCLPNYGNKQLGTGDGDIVKIVRDLLNRGFDGTFVLENNYANNNGIDVGSDLKTLRMICDS